MSATVTQLGLSRSRNTFSIGLMIALSSWGLIFVTLIWGYVVYRLRSTSWMGEYLSSPVYFMATLNTIAMAMSSWCLTVALKDKVLKPVLWAWNSFGLGVVFLIGQWRLWHTIMLAGLHWQKSIAGSFFFLLTGFHALHIIGGLTALFILCLRLNDWQGSLKSIGIKYFWDFLFVVWMMMFVLIFIIQ